MSLFDYSMVKEAIWLEIIWSLTYKNNFSFDSHYDETLGLYINVSFVLFIKMIYTTVAHLTGVVTNLLGHRFVTSEN